MELPPGRYSIVKDIVTWHGFHESTFVYKKDQGAKAMYLYHIKDEGWVVGNVAGDSLCSLHQIQDNDQTLYSASKTKPWYYYCNNSGWQSDDKTLKVFPCYY